MGRHKLKYAEGDVFRVPLEGGRQAVGVVARADGTGGILAYFFPFGAIEQLCPEDSTLVAHVGDLALMGSGGQRVGLGEVRWPVIGHLADFTRTAWPVPRFYDGIAALGVSRVASYDDDMNEIGRTAAAPGDERRYHPDGLYGWKAAENYLKKLLHTAPAVPVAVPATSKKTTKRKIAAKTAMP